MIYQVNKGNILPAYSNRAHQRHRQPGTDSTPFGVLAPRTRGLPFQIRYEDEEFVDTLVFTLVSAVDDLTTITLSNDLLLVEEEADGIGFWVTYKADQALNVVPDCGYWYFVLSYNAVNKYFEVMHMRDMAGFESGEITVTDCNVSGSDIEIELTPVVYASPGYTVILERLGVGWSTISTGEDPYTQTENLAAGAANYRITITSVYGYIITRRFQVTWTDCEDIAVAFVSATVNSANAGFTPVWRLMFTSAKDKGSVLYQSGYEQYFYFTALIWDVPEIERELEVSEDGYGNEVTRFSRTVTRQKFEAPDIPDFVLPFLFKSSDLTTQLQNAEISENYDISRLTVETRRQGAALNTGTFTFDSDVDIYNGCLTDFELV